MPYIPRIAPPYIGWTEVRPLPASSKVWTASWITNPAKDMAFALLAYQYTKKPQQFTLDGENYGFVTVFYRDGKAIVCDATDTPIAEETLSDTDIDIMLAQIAHDVGQHWDDWLLWDREPKELPDEIIA